MSQPYLGTNLGGGECAWKEYAAGVTPFLHPATPGPLILPVAGEGSAWTKRTAVPPYDAGTAPGDQHLEGTQYLTLATPGEIMRHGWHPRVWELTGMVSLTFPEGETLFMNISEEFGDGAGLAQDFTQTPGGDYELSYPHSAPDGGSVPAPSKLVSLGSVGNVTGWAGSAEETIAVDLKFRTRVRIGRCNYYLGGVGQGIFGVFVDFYCEAGWVFAGPDGDEFIPWSVYSRAYGESFWRKTSSSTLDVTKIVGGMDIADDDGDVYAGVDLVDTRGPLEESHLSILFESPLLAKWKTTHPSRPDLP